MCFDLTLLTCYL